MPPSTTPSPVTPYLTIRGASDAALWYARALGATEVHRAMAEDGARALHIHLEVNGGSVFLMDEFPEQGGAVAPVDGRCPPVAMTLQLAAPADVDALHARATAAGATTTMKPDDMFWGARFAAISDPFGHQWMFNAPLAG